MALNKQCIYPNKVSGETFSTFGRNINKVSGETYMNLRAKHRMTFGRPLFFVCYWQRYIIAFTRYGHTIAFT